MPECPQLMVSQSSLSELELPACLCDAFQNLENRLAASRNGDGPARILAFTSCYPGEGVSTVATNLAVSLAQKSQRPVLLVDANLEDPSLHRSLGLALAPGLAEYLAAPEPAAELRLGSFRNVHVLCAGARPKGEIAGHDLERLGLLLRQMAQVYSQVLVDLPALSLSPAVPGLAALAEGVVLVLESERVRWQVAEKHIGDLGLARANFLGAVLNRRRYYVPHWLYRRL